MGVITTRELLDKVYELYSPYKSSLVYTIQKMIDKPVLFDYEKEISTDLVDMSQDQLFGLINRILHHKQNKDGDHYLRMGSYDYVRHALYNIFEVYISIHPMANPMRSPVFVKDNVRRILMQGKSAFTWGTVENLLTELRYEYPPEHVEYIELIMQLFYCGFQTWSELINLEASQINHQTKTIVLPGRTIKLSDRCYALLINNQRMVSFKGNYKTFYFVPWRNKYLKYMMTASAADRINDKTEQSIHQYARTIYARSVLNGRAEQINYSVLFNLGFYNYIVSKYGKERARSMILTHDRENIPLWKQVQIEYGLTHRTIGKLQDDLIGCIEL